MVGYSGTPLLQKLGIKDGHRVRVVNPPAHLDALIPGVTPAARGSADIAWIFTASRAELAKKLPALAKAVFPNGMVWVSWPKKASKVPTDITEDTIREVAFPLGLVDVKVCAVDDVWSGLKVVWRKENR
jgi:hypothetical protein